MKVILPLALYRFQTTTGNLLGHLLLYPMNMFSYYLRQHAPGNVAVWDRVLRALPAVATIALYASGVIGNAVALGLGIVSVGLLATSATGKCSVYYALGTGTQRDSTGARVSGRPNDM